MCVFISMWMLVIISNGDTPLNLSTFHNLSRIINTSFLPLWSWDSIYQRKYLSENGHLEMIKHFKEFEEVIRQRDKILEIPHKVAHPEGTFSSAWRPEEQPRDSYLSIKWRVGL